MALRALSRTGVKSRRDTGVAAMRPISRILRHIWPALVLAVVMGCASGGNSVTLIPLPPPASQSDYVLQAGDVLNMKFHYHPDHDQRDLVVRMDGKLFLPLLGDIQAAGLTPEQLAEQLAQT